MKFSPALAALPVALGIGFLVGKQGEGESKETAKPELPPARESRPVRSPRVDPFGGPSFSLSSMDEIRALFKKQRASVASARLTLSADSLSADQIPALMEMVQQDYRENPNDYEGRYVLMGVLFERWALVDPAASIEFAKNCNPRSFQKQVTASCFGALAQVDSNQALLELEKLPKGEMRETAGMQILSALGDRDPSAACDLLERESSPGGFGPYYASQVFAKWAKIDPAAAAARLASMPPDRVNERCASQLAANWAQKDPEAALKWAKTLKGEWKSGSAIEVYKALSRDDPAGTWEKLKGEPGHLRGKLIGGVLETVADEDPQKAMALLKTLESKSERRIAAGQFIDQLSWNETRLAFDVIKQLDDPATRRQQLGQQMYYAAWTSPDLLKEQIAKMSDREKIETSDSVMRGLLASDPKGAEKYFLDLPEAQRSTDTLENLMERYSNLDPKKAFDFATSLENPQEQTAAVKGLFSQWSQEDPEAAADGWKKLPAGEGRLGALDKIAASWGESDPDAAKQWAEGLSGTERVRALAAVLPSLAKDDPKAAGGQLAALLQNPPDGMANNLASSAGSLAGTWASDDPASAATWAADLPDGQSRDKSLGAVSSAWSQYDAVATAEWLGTLASGESRDAAVQPLVSQVRQTDPSTAFSWAATIGDPADRMNQLGQTLKSWRGADPAAARAALDAADLAPEERTKLEKELE